MLILSFVAVGVGIVGYLEL